MDGERRSPSPAWSDSPIGGYWDEFPISEFVLTLYEPVKRTQWLPQAVADALEGDGPFRFLLHLVGARQGPWEVLAQVVVNGEGDGVPTRAGFYSGWKCFANFYRLAPPFLVHFRLHHVRGIFIVKVFDGTLCLRAWEGSDDEA